MSLSKFREDNNGGTSLHCTLKNDTSIPSKPNTPHNRAIAQERLRFELEFALEPDFDAIELLLQALQEWGAAE